MPELVPCRKYDPDLWFPVGSTGPALMQEREAISLCLGCPIRRECLAQALEQGIDHGVWGGMSATDRRALKRKAEANALAATANQMA